MNKTTALLTIILTVFLLAGCTPKAQQNTANAGVTGTLIGWYDDTFEIQKDDGTIVKIHNDYAAEGMPIYEVKGGNNFVSYNGEKRDLIGKTVYIKTENPSSGRTRINQLAARLK